MYAKVALAWSSLQIITPSNILTCLRKQITNSLYPLDCDIGQGLKCTSFNTKFSNFFNGINFRNSKKSLIGFPDNPKNK